MEGSLLFKPVASFEDKRDVFKKLEEICISDNAASLASEAFMSIINAQVKLFDLRNIILFEYGTPYDNEEARKSTESHIQRCEDRLRSAEAEFEFIAWPFKLTDKGKQFLRYTDKAVAESSSYEEFIAKLNEQNRKIIVQ